MIKKIRTAPKKKRKTRDIFGGVPPDFVELLRELVSTLVCFERAHKAAADILISCRNKQDQKIDPLVDPLILACLDAAYAIKGIVNTKHFDFVNKHDPRGLLHSLDRARAKKRHPQKFVSNTIYAGKSQLSGVKICYGKVDQEWMCQVIFFNGASGDGKASPLPKGLILNENWKDRIQIVYFIGLDDTVNLSVLLHDFDAFAKSLLNDLVEKSKSDGNMNFLHHLQIMHRYFDEDICNTFYYTLAESKKPTPE